MPLAALFLYASGIRAQFFTEFVPGITGVVLDGCLTFVWVVGITASFSILDHMDGLCAGIAAVAAGFFTLSATLNGQTMVRTLGAAALGAALGFLRWNFNPAKIFMGDGGAMFLGFLMATLGLKIRPEGSHFPATWLVPVLILGVPIFDTTLVSISRARRGLLPFTSPGKDHTAHRLSNIGLGHRGAVLAVSYTHLPPPKLRARPRRRACCPSRFARFLPAASHARTPLAPRLTHRAKHRPRFSIRTRCRTHISSRACSSRRKQSLPHCAQSALRGATRSGGDGLLIPRAGRPRWTHSQEFPGSSCAPIC